MKQTGLAAQFVEGARGRLLVVTHQPDTPARGCVLIVPPFAEEMNKCRRMMTETAMALAPRGIATVLPDLYGTGDSAGEFGEADWAGWVSDIEAIVHWARAAGHPVAAVLGVRLGCALAASALDACGAVVRTSVFWQPVTDGARFLAQFMRLRVAASMMTEQGGESIAQLRERLQQAARIEIAGYELSSRLAAQLETVRIDDVLGSQLGRVYWMEVVRDAAGDLQGASRNSIQRARERGLELQTQLVVGEPFWSSTEIVLLPELIEHTVRALES